MRFRDRPHAGSQTVRQFSDLSAEAIDRLPAVLSELAADPRAVAFRMRWPEDRDRGQLSPAEAVALIPEALTRLEDGLDEHALMVAAARKPFVGLPIKVVISGTKVAFVCSHAAFDGSQFVGLLAHVLARCAGQEHRLDERRPEQRPILRALPSISLVAALRGALRDRGIRPTPPPPPSPSAADRALDTASLAHVTMDRATLTTIRALPRDVEDGHASLNMRICSLALTALREVQRGQLDLPVDVPVNLRRYLPDTQVVGNFIGVLEVGGLRTADLRPTPLATRMEESLSSGAPVISMLLGGLGPIRRRILGRARPASDPAQGELSLTMSMLQWPEPFPDVWAADSPRRIRVATVGLWPSPTMVALMRLEDEAQLSVWDEGGQFDLDAFPHAFQAQLGPRQDGSSAATTSA